jgi:membrane-bound inhibitor of C-type lysozyme
VPNAAIPTAAAGKSTRNKKLLKKTRPRLLAQRTVLETVKARRGAMTSHNAITIKMPKKKLIRIVFSWVMTNSLISIVTPISSSGAKWHKQIAVLH